MVVSTCAFVHYSENKFVSNNKQEASLLTSRCAAVWSEVQKGEEFISFLGLERYSHCASTSALN